MHYNFDKSKPFLKKKKKDNDSIISLDPTLYYGKN